MKTMRTWVLALATTLAAAASAQSYNYFQTEVGTGINEDYGAVYSQNDTSFQSRTQSIDGVATATGTAQLDFGVNKVSASVAATDPNAPVSSIWSWGSTQWIDEVTIDGGDLNGTLGTFTASLRVSGNESIVADGIYASEGADLYGFWDSWIGTSTDGGSSYLVGGWFGSYYSDYEGGIYYEGDELNQPLTEVTLEFIYGQPFLLSGKLDVYFQADNYDLAPGTISAALDFSHSAYWNGIGGFYDANGNAVSINGLSSGSGIDWRNEVNAVPEPASLFALGLGGLALLRRRRASR